MAIVNLNNELKELDNQELAEIEKILESLSAQTAAEIEYIKYDFDTLAELDFIFARASFARSYKGTEPVFNTEGIVDIKQEDIRCWRSTPSYLWTSNWVRTTTSSS